MKYKCLMLRANTTFNKILPQTSISLCYSGVQNIVAPDYMQKSFFSIEFRI